jgi:DNA polymerase I-like protein with 3'-5' exonuclease and polymerase domains
MRMGRMSSSKPNLQNFHIRTELGAQILEAFAAVEDFRIDYDYRQEWKWLLCNPASIK